ncbi:MAG: putative glycosidase, partial [Acidimicrobiales bacterium]|nr:putative glycosidase [Acidimicrobiales bacterium]
GRAAGGRAARRGRRGPALASPVMDLGGTWRAAVADDDLRRRWLDEPDDRGWEPIEVPGHWRSTPAFAHSDGPLLYRTRFEHPGPEADDRWFLTLDGLFYQGDVWLDGGYVGDTEGYFFPHTFEVTAGLAARTEHDLGVEVTCSRPSDRTAKRNITGSFQHAAGDDPDANPGGIWRPVRLERTGPVRIRHLRVRCRDAEPTRATVAFRAVLDAAEAGEVTIRSTVGGAEVVDQRVLAAGENQFEWTLDVADPALWWPHALGEQPLADVAVEVVRPDGTVSHRRERRIGLRRVNLRAWVLHVNGERLFLKGANQGPSRQALADATPVELAADITLAKDIGLDLLRLQAHISRPELYDAADEAGMLLWQDFPLHQGYARGLRKQAARQAREAVDLLAHHPSVAIWCGHDEPVPFDGGSPTGPRRSRRGRFLLGQELPSWNKTVLDHTVKRTLEQADGSRPVIAHSGVLPHPPQLDGTDSHLWFGWYHGDERDLPGFARAVPRMVRFVSAFGAQAVPDDAEFMEPGRWPDLDWAQLERTHGLQKAQFDRHVRPADRPSFEAWQRSTQAYQARVIKHQVEALRRLKYRPTGGFALSSWADGHPAVSWSVLDHERRPKLGFAALRAACRPVIVVADRLPAEVAAGDALAIDVHVVSDLRAPLVGAEVSAELTWDGGQQTWRFAGDVPADACARIGTLQVVVPDRPGPLRLALALQAEGVTTDNRDDTTIVRR